MQGAGAQAQTQGGGEDSGLSSVHGARRSVAAFNSWAQKATALRAADKTALDASAVERGVALAKDRWVAIEKWMRTDPARALAAVVRELEKPFSAVGDYTVQCAMQAVGGPFSGQGMRRHITIDGATYPAHIYGRRLNVTTRQNIFLHGFLLGGEAVLDDNILRVLSADEIAIDPRAAGAAGKVIAEGGPRLYRFDSAEQIQQAEARLRAIEAHHTPETSGISEEKALADPASVPTTPDSAYTTGPKKVLVIRVDFSDKQGSSTVFDFDTIKTISDEYYAPYFSRSSYGSTSLPFTVSTKIYRLPRTAADYATNNDNRGLHADASAAATADYAVDGYDRVIVFFRSLGEGDIPGSKITYGGLADLGAKRVWVNGTYSFAVVAHELGHTYGLVHANLWQVSDGNPISPNGVSAEYGDPFDTMGINLEYTARADFNV